MIYSKMKSDYVPVTIAKTVTEAGEMGNFIRYNFYDGKIPAGFVDLVDTKNGINVAFLKNRFPELYSGIGELADKVEVAHCMQRGLDTFEITSNAALNSHALHYLRGKRFGEIKDEKLAERLFKEYKTTDVNKIVENIIKQTKNGEKYITSFLGSIPMYMPKEMITKYIEILKKFPLRGI